MYDADSDGFVNKSELEQILRAYFGARAGVVEQMVTIEELDLEAEDLELEEGVQEAAVLEEAVLVEAPLGSRRLSFTAS